MHFWQVLMKESSRHRRPNIYEMFLEHGGPGFWVKRVTWIGTCARITRVGAFKGGGPYFGNPVVLGDLYKLGGEFKDLMVPLPAPGGSSWEKMDVPRWAATKFMEPLSYPIYDEALAHWERKQAWDRGLDANVAKVWLNVPFDQKDEAKALRARWSPDERKWWLPANETEWIERARTKGFIE